MSTFETIELSIDAPRARIRLNRPHRLNALTPVTLRELAEAAATLDALDAVRVVRVDGHGGAFCAGIDLTAVAPLVMPPDPEALRELARLGAAMVDAVGHMRAVTVASVERCAVGAGLLLMGACDLRVVCDDATLSIPEARLGLPLTWGGVPRLLRELGPALVRELIMTGRPLDPVEAQAMGFVNRVVAAEALHAETEALMAELLDAPALPLRATKAQVNEALHALLPVESDDAELGVAAISDPTFPEAAMRYLQKLRSDI